MYYSMKELKEKAEKSMNRKQNYLAALNHQPTEWTPSGFDCASIGFDDLWFEKGPAGGGYDGFGVKWIRPASGMGAPIPAPGEFALTDVLEWKKLQFPDVDSFDWEGLFAPFLASVDRNELAVDFGFGNGQFERLGALMGFEEALMAMYEEPEATYDLLSAITDYKIKVVEKVAQYLHPDSLTSFDDTCTQMSPFMSPDTYEELILPQHKRLNDACREHGIIPVLHCCGNAEALVPYFIEEGDAAWSSVQPVNDIVALLDKYGDKLTLIGGFDTNGPAGFSLKEDIVRADVRRCMSSYGNRQGYIFRGFVTVSDENKHLAPVFSAAMLDEYNKCLAEMRMSA